MNTFGRGVLVVIGLIAVILGLAFLSLIFRYAPLWGTRESLFVLVYTILFYLTLGGATVAFVPRERTAEFVAGVGGSLAAIFGLGILYYLLAGRGALGIYLVLVLIFALIVQAVAAGGFLFLGRVVLEDSAA